MSREATEVEDAFLQWMIANGMLQHKIKNHKERIVVTKKGLLVREFLNGFVGAKHD